MNGWGTRTHTCTTFIISTATADQKRQMNPIPISMNTDRLNILIPTYPICTTYIGIEFGAPLER